jgi:hypothetical protein
MCPPRKPLEHIPGCRAARFNLHGKKGAAFFNNQVDLMAGLVPPEKNRGRKPLVIKGLHHLGHDVILEQGAPKGMREKLIFIMDAEQLAGEARVVEIQLGALDDPQIMLVIYD